MSSPNPNELQGVGLLPNGVERQPDQAKAWLTGDLGYVTNPLPQNENGSNDRIKNVWLSETQGRK